MPRTVGSLMMIGVLAIAPLLACAQNPFAPPAEFAADIHFWTRVYTEVGTDGGFVHDDRHLGVVYEVMLFPADLSRAERSRRVEAAKDRYRTVLKKLATGAAPDTDEALRVRALWPENTSASTFAEAVNQLRFQLGQANRFKEGLIRAGAYEAHIAETLVNMGLPPELAALPHVESSFDPTAYSHAGAAGLWQFIRSTGRRYMRIDADVDERMDAYRSTVAAARFLKYNYDLLGAWPLAITAYNHGPAGMRRAKERAGTDDIVTIARTYQSRTFGFASRNYYVAFLAALEVDRDPERYFGKFERHAEIRTRPVTLSAYVPVAALQNAFGIDLPTLRQLNPALTSAVWRGERYVPHDFELRLPESLTGDPMVRLAALGPGVLFDSQRPELLHRVRSGDTLSAIAARNGTTVSALMQANGLRDARRLRAGQSLRIPQPAEARVLVAQAKTRQQARAQDKAESEARTRTEAAVQAQQPSGPPEPVVSAEEIGAAEQAVAEAENVQPVSEEEAEDIGPQLVASEPGALMADPNDYGVSEDLTIEIQAAETLGHVAEWLDLRASRLRELNRMRFNQPVVIGQRLKIELPQISVNEFERRRRAYHQGIQEEFFAANRIVGTAVHVIRRGESLWSIAQANPSVPIWLLRQHNPDIDFADVRPKTQIVLPNVEPVTPVAHARP